MMISIPKSSMLNQSYIAGLILFFIFTGDVFADNDLNKQSSPNINSKLEQKGNNNLDSRLKGDKQDTQSPQNTKDSINLLQKELSPPPGQTIPILIPKDISTSENITENIPHGVEYVSFMPFFDGRIYKNYIPDGVKFISNKNSFIKLGVDISNTAQFVRQVGEQFDTIFKDEISDQTKENKLIVLQVKIFSDLENNENCDTECSNMKISFHSNDKFGSNIIKFSKVVRNLDKIKITNPQSEEIVDFQIYLNTKPENFVLKMPFTKKPSRQSSPFQNIG